MGQIYIAYRHDDAAITGRIADRLQSLFGEQTVMKDVELGAASDGLVGAMRRCSAALVIIGPAWLSGMLANPQNQTYSEIEAALRQGMPVIPVLVHGATLPDARLLPQPLWPLVTRGVIVLSAEPVFDRDIATLGETLRRLAPPGGFQPVAAPFSRRAPALPGEVGAQAQRASLGRRALITALVVAVLIASCGGGGTLLARRLSSATAFLLPEGALLYDIANPPGTDDAWVVGGNYDSCVLLRYTGGLWSRVSCPLSAGLNSVSFANSGEGWAVGGDADGCRLLHFHAGSWSKVTCPIAKFEFKPIVRMDAHGSGWITGGEATLRYVNDAWTIYRGALPLGGFTTLGVSGGGDAWATGDDGFHQATNGVWTAVQTPQFDEASFFQSIDFSRSSDQGWAVGDIGKPLRAYIGEYQNGQWQPYTPMPSVSSLTMVRVGLFGDVWAAGGATPSNGFLPTGLIMRYDGQQWKTLGDPVDGVIYGITDVPDGDAWAVAATAQAQPALLWYHGGYWRIYHES